MGSSWSKMLLLVLFMTCVLSAFSDVRHFDLIIEEANFTKLCSSKSMLTANGTFPGPTIRVFRGERFFVNVYNNGNYGVTIHWHGVRQPGNPWSDGPENVTQCPIQAGGNFTYEVILSGEEGTLWWHAHSDWTRATVHGAIIVSPPPGLPYPFPVPHDETTLLIASWYKSDVKAIYDEAMASGGEFNVSDAFTINGEPGDLYSCSNDTTYWLSVEQNKTYLLRIINAVMNEEHFFAIAGHNLTVVGHDGAYIKPITTNYIFITPGQTFDVLLTADQSPGYYYIASTPFSDNFVQFDNTTTTAILAYEGWNASDQSSIPLPQFPNYDDEYATLNFTRKLKSLHPVTVPMIVDQRMLITIAVNFYSCGENETCGNRIAASLNNISFVEPEVDILTAYYQNWSGIYEDDFPSWPVESFNFTGDVDGISSYTIKGTRVKILSYGEAVEIVFQGTSIQAAENHPIHLHGLSFFMVGIGLGNFDNETDPLSYNLIDPPEINTFGVPKNGWVAIRFFADNPGVWFVHCHMDRHSSWGMDTVLIVKNGDSEATSLRDPPSYMPPCSAPSSSMLQMEDFVGNASFYR